MKYILLTRSTTYLTTFFGKIENFCGKRKINHTCRCDHYSRAETNQGRKLLISRRFLLRKLFKGGNYSRAETIRGNTVTNLWRRPKLGRFWRSLLIFLMRLWNTRFTKPHEVENTLLNKNMTFIGVLNIFMEKSLEQFCS